MREQRGSTLTKWALAGEQSGGTLVSQRSRVGLGSGKLYNIIRIRLSVRLLSGDGLRESSGVCALSLGALGGQTVPS